MLKNFKMSLVATFAFCSAHVAANVTTNDQLTIELQISGQKVIEKTLSSVGSLESDLELMVISDDRNYMLDLSLNPLALDGTEQPVSRIDATVLKADSTERVKMDSGYSDFINFEGVSVQRLLRPVADSEVIIEMPQSDDVKGAIVVLRLDSI